MSLFFARKENYLGIDIGTASIKVVELKESGGNPALVTFGYIDIVTDIIRSTTPQTQQKIIDSLKRVIASAQVTTDKAFAALPTFSVFNSIITLPAMSQKDLALAVKWEAKKYVPMPLEEMILDWKVIEGTEANEVKSASAKTADNKQSGGLFKFNLKKDKSADLPDQEAAKGGIFEKKDRQEQQKNIKILVTAAPQNLVNRYMALFKAAGLKLMSLETEAFALARSLIGKQTAMVMIVDIGSITTDICIIERGVPILNRSIDVGGLTITQSIANSLNINLERAEQFKRDIGITINSNTEQKGIPKTIMTAVSPIINEVKYVLDLYQNQSNQQVEKIVLSGGSAFLPNLTAYFTSLFNKPTLIGNPWDNVAYPDELKPVLDEVGSRLAVAIGLAMRDI